MYILTNHSSVTTTHRRFIFITSCLVLVCIVATLHGMYTLHHKDRRQTNSHARVTSSSLLGCRRPSSSQDKERQGRPLQKEVSQKFVSISQYDECTYNIPWIVISFDCLSGHHHDAVRMGVGSLMGTATRHDKRARDVLEFMNTFMDGSNDGLMTSLHNVLRWYLHCTCMYELFLLVNAICCCGATRWSSSMITPIVRFYLLTTKDMSAVCRRLSACGVEWV